MSAIVVQTQALSHSYGTRLALDAIHLSVNRGEFFGILGPNGGGKSTLFKILSTLIPPSQGTVFLFGKDVRANTSEIRKQIGVVFQSPAVDKKLTVQENLLHQAHLYGLFGKTLAARIQDLMLRMGLSERANDLVETLSGGLIRRVEIAKALIHQPRLLILDEPTTGLDPLVRREIWEYLSRLRASDFISVILTTHLMDEAETCDRICILDQGKMVALGKPADLREDFNADVITIRTRFPEKMKTRIEAVFGNSMRILSGAIRMERKNGHQFVSDLMPCLGDDVESVTVGKPTLEDVFVKATGHQFREIEDV